MMLEELQRRHYSEATTQRYIRFIERFAQHFHCSPDRPGPQRIREYQAQLFTLHKPTPGSVTNHLCALHPRRYDACAAESVVHTSMVSQMTSNAMDAPRAPR